MTDFRKVVNAAKRAFGNRFVFKPVVSQPGAPAYEVVGVYSNRLVDYQIEGKAVQTVYSQTMGVNLSDFQVTPRQKDKIVYEDKVYDVRDIDLDGRGGASITLIEGKPS